MNFSSLTTGLCTFVSVTSGLSGKIMVSYKVVCEIDAKGPRHGHHNHDVVVIYEER